MCSDLTDNATNQKLILEFYNSKKPTASVCHGPTVFVNIKDADGERFVKGKKVSSLSPSLSLGGVLSLLSRVLKLDRPWTGHLLL